MSIGPVLLVQFHCTKLVCHRIYLFIYILQNPRSNQCPFSLTWKRMGKKFWLLRSSCKVPTDSCRRKGKTKWGVYWLAIPNFWYQRLLLTVLFVFRKFNLLWFGVYLFSERNHFISIVIGRRAAWGCLHGMPSKASSGSILCSTFCFSVLSWFVRVWAALENTVPGKKSNNKTSLSFYLRQQSTKRLLPRK